MIRIYIENGTWTVECDCAIIRGITNLDRAVEYAENLEPDSDAIIEVGG